ncbi:hypothetical protein BC829DRAFT_390048 [Chytridium lagenaria]|nr:hypothetical protein BC829DRAFT_390048 [Chytridium lagenaria]
MSSSEDNTNTILTNSFDKHGRRRSPSVLSSRTGSQGGARGWEKTVASYKSAFFDLLCSMMKNEGGIDQYFAVGVIPISTLNVARPVIKAFGQQGQLGLIGLSLTIVFLTLANAGYNLHSFYTKNFKAGVWPLRAMKILVQWQTTLLYIPTLNLHRFLIVICGIFIVLYAAFIMLMSIAYFQPDPRTPNFDARPLPIAEFLEVTLKTAVTLSSEAVVGTRHTYVISLLIFFASTAAFLAGLKSLPYYQFLANIIKFTLNMVLQYASFLSLILAFLPQNDSNTVFYVFVGGAAILVPLHTCFNIMNIKHLTSKKRVEDALIFIKKSELKADEKARAFVEYLKMTSPKDPTILSRFVWKDPTPENIDLVESLFQYSIQHFTPETDDLSRLMKARRRRKQAQKIKYPPGAAFLNEQMDAVDRVEYKQLLKQASTYHRETGKYLSTFWKLRRAVRSVSKSGSFRTRMHQVFYILKDLRDNVHRYYTLLYSRFGYIPRVLQQYADFCDLVARIDEGEGLRAELSDLMEETAADDGVDGRSQFSDSQQRIEVAGSNGSPSAYLSARRGTLALPDFPPMILRPVRERRALKAFKRAVSEIQNFHRKRTSLMIAGFCFGLLVIASSTVGSIEFLLLDQVHTSGNMSFWALETVFTLRQMQLTTWGNRPENFTLLKRQLGETVNHLQSANYKRKIVPWVTYLGVDLSTPFAIENRSLVDVTRLYASHASELQRKDMEFFSSFYNTSVLVSGVLQDMRLTNHSITQPWRQEIKVVMLLLIAMYSVWVGLLLGMGMFVLRPFVRYVELQRHSVITAFLHLPQSTCIEMFLQYRYDKNRGRGDGEEFYPDEANDSGGSDDEASNQSRAFALKGTSSRFRAIKAAYIWGLIIIWLQMQMASAGRRLQRSASIPFLVQGFAAISTEILFADPISSIPKETYAKVIFEELGLFTRYREAILYGNSSMNLAPYKLSKFERDIFFQKRYQSNTVSLHNLCNRVLEDAVRLISLPNFSPYEPAYRSLLSNSPDVVKGYLGYANHISSGFRHYREILSLVSTKILFPITIFFVFVIYWKSFQFSLKMVLEENSKTIRLILMMPLSAVAKNENIRKLLSNGIDITDIPEFHALSGSSDDGKIRDIMKSLHQQSNSRQRSSSVPNKDSEHRRAPSEFMPLASSPLPLYRSPTVASRESVLGDLDGIRQPASIHPSDEQRVTTGANNVHEKRIELDISTSCKVKPLPDISKSRQKRASVSFSNEEAEDLKKVADGIRRSDAESGDYQNETSEAISFRPGAAFRLPPVEK